MLRRTRYRPGIALAAAAAAAGLAATVLSPPNALAGANSAGQSRYGLASPHTWKLVESESFARQVNADAYPWVRDPLGDASPWNVDDVDDDGKFFRVLGGDDFTRHLASFNILRKQVPLGKNGWLTAEVAARDYDKNGLPDAPPTISNVRVRPGESALKLNEPSHDTGVIIRPTDKLPPRYRVEVTLSTIDFGGQRNGTWDYDGKHNGYSPEGCKSNFPWKRSLDFSGPSDQCNPKFNAVRDANGYYFLSIMDYARPAPHNNVFIHSHRKVGIDEYNVADPGESSSYAVCNPLTHSTYNYASGSTGNAVNPLFMAGERYQNSSYGYTAFDMQTECGTFDGETPPDHEIVSAAELKPELMPNEQYQFAIERSSTGYTMEITGDFRYVGHKTLRQYRPFVSADGKAAIWHYNNTAQQYDGRFNTDLVFGKPGDPAHSYVHKDMWPAGSAYPDYFILGDPHMNYYEGSSTITDLRMYVPRH